MKKIMLGLSFEGNWGGGHLLVLQTSTYGCSGIFSGVVRCGVTHTALQLYQKSRGIKGSHKYIHVTNKE